MPRIIVIPDAPRQEIEGVFFMDEEVHPEHLQGHAADQLIERVGWAVCDATDVAQQAVSSRAIDAVRPHS